MARAARRGCGRRVAPGGLWWWRRRRHDDVRLGVGPGRARRRARVGRRVAPRHRPDHGGAGLPGAWNHRDRPRPGRELDGVGRRAHVDLPAERRRDVPRRRAVQRRGRLFQLRPLVQLLRAAPELQRLVLLADRLPRVRQQRGRGVGTEPLRQLRGTGRADRGDHDHRAFVFVPRRARAHELRDRQPGGPDRVRGRCRNGGRGSRRLPADRHVRHGASDRHRPLQVRFVGAR